MSVFTSAWFWILVVGIIMAIVGAVIWIVTGVASIAVGLLLGAGAAFIISGLIIWIFGRNKGPKPPANANPKQTNPMESGNIGAIQPTITTSTTTQPGYGYGGYQVPPQQGLTMMGANPTTTTMVTSGVAQPQNYNNNTGLSQQQLMQLIQNNPQLANQLLAGSKSTAPPLYI